MEDKLTPFTKEVFDLTLKEWRVIVNDSGYGFFPTCYQIIASNEQHAVEILIWYMDNCTYGEYIKFVTGEEDFNEFPTMTDGIHVYVGKDFDGIPCPEADNPSIREIDLFKFTMGEITILENGKVPWPEDEVAQAEEDKLAEDADEDEEY